MAPLLSSESSMGYIEEALGEEGQESGVDLGPGGRDAGVRTPATCSTPCRLSQVVELGKKKGRESINSQWNKTNGTWPRINPTNGEPNKHGMSEDTHGVG